MKTTQKTTQTRGRSHGAVAWLAALLTLAGCNELDLNPINQDPTRLQSVDPRFLFNSAVVNSAPNSENYRCDATTVQQHYRVFTGFFACANFNVAQRLFMLATWNTGYQGRLRPLLEVMAATADNPQRQNLYHMARILRAHAIMRVTDTYGDVPYAEAALGYSDGVVFPQYDKQQAIYTGPQGILEELKSATAALNPSSPTVTEPLYNGSVAQWQRFGNSLLLRAAMRLSKVDPELARQYVQSAVNGPGGLMSGNGDNAMIRHTEEYRNDMGVSMNSNEGFNEYMPAPFVDFMKNRGDPRLGAYAVRYPTASAFGEMTPDRAVTDPAQQIGLPVGYDNNSIAPIVGQLGLPSVYAFTQADRRRVFHVLAPTFLITYSQTQLHLAEAAHRGWIPGNPATHFANAIRADLQRVSTSYQNTAIPQSAIDAFVAATPLDLAGNVLEQINNEYWVASYVTPDESWANFRRSCYPVLSPNMRGDLPTNESFMRRLLYPEAEIDLNPHYETGAQPDNLGSRVWWDVRVNERC